MALEESVLKSFEMSSFVFVCECLDGEFIYMYIQYVWFVCVCVCVNTLHVFLVQMCACACLRAWTGCYSAKVLAVRVGSVN